jgi:hypothetical protein
MVRRMNPEMARGGARLSSRLTAAMVRVILAAACLIGLLALSLSWGWAKDDINSSAGFSAGIGRAREGFEQLARITYVSMSEFLKEMNIPWCGE